MYLDPSANLICRLVTGCDVFKGTLGAVELSPFDPLADPAAAEGMFCTRPGAGLKQIKKS